eukprot:TRINITY_DN4769_c0_g2_i1.p1 TRINITY_DN4769_c0_g2~~TRINITY_DN4769_c0_g2_i1.p1  ORF type:complete len:642 (+),score=105.03 TRINITY_DN4769_c0_g2_i1:110-2035(+)
MISVFAFLLLNSASAAVNSSCDAQGGRRVNSSYLLQQRSFQEHDTRSLLSKRESRSVPCWDTITDAAKCGTDTITNGDVCGWSVITSAAKCGSSVTKICDQRRRRRCCNKVSCKATSVAKSCKEPKSCTVAKSCDMADSWSSCFSDVTKAVSGEYSKYADCVTQSGCSSIDGCAKTVKSGMDCAWDVLADTLQSGVKTIIESEVVDKLPFDPRSVISSAKSEAANVFSDVDLSAVTSILGGIFGPFSPYDIDPCPRAGVNFWYMSPTDCGTFGHLADVLDNAHNAQSNFDKCKDSLEECVKLEGALGFPTPFLEFKVDNWCLPNYIETPLEYMLGAFKYAHDSGAALVSAISGLFTKLKDFVQNNLGMSMVQLGREVKSQRLALLQGNATLSKAGTWSLGTGICFDYPFPLLTASACVHLIWGEVDGQFVEPNLGFEVVLTKSIFGVTSFDAGEPEPGFSLSLAFMDDYPGYLPASEPRVGGSAALQLSLDAEIQGIAEVGAALSIFFLPDVSAALGFGLGITFARDAATDLVQTTMMAQAKEAERQMHAKGQSHLSSTAGLMTALHHLSDNIDTVLGQVELHHAPALLKKTASKPLQEHVPKTSLEQGSEGMPPVKITGKVEAVMAVGICLTMPNCNGQR